MSVKELVRCPFCQAGEGEIDQVNDEAYAVIRQECGAQGPMAVSPQAAIACWESRGTDA